MGSGLTRLLGRAAESEVLVVVVMDAPPLPVSMAGAIVTGLQIPTPVDGPFI